jgi:hypothetical protein
MGLKSRDFRDFVIPWLAKGIPSGKATGNSDLLQHTPKLTAILFFILFA